MTDLLDRLADDAAPVKALTGRRFLATYGLGMGAALLIVAATGFRQDLPIAASDPMFLTKLLVTGALALPSAWLMWLSGRPGAQSGRGAHMVGLLALLLFAAPLALAFAFDAEVASRDALRFDWAQFCVPIIALTTIPVWFASLSWLRRAAPVNAERASWLAGLASASTGALLFALHCPFDSLAYVAVWYFSSIIGLAALSRMIMPRFIRW